MRWIRFLAALRRQRPGSRGEDTWGNSMKTYSRLTLAFLLLILIVPQVRANEPPENGPHVKYYDNGQKWVERRFKNGDVDGLSTWWDVNGSKINEIEYKDGEEVSRKKF